LLKLQSPKDTLRLQDLLLELVSLTIEIDDGNGDLEIASEPLMSIMFDRLNGAGQRQHAFVPQME